MKYIEMREFLNFDNAIKIKILREIAQGKTKIREDNKMPKINVIEIRVKEVLENFPDTRENDNLLYVTYLKEYHYVDFTEDVFINYEEHGLPSFKSIERARREIQNKQNLYKASEKVEKNRKEAEKTYIQNYSGDDL